MSRPRQGVRARQGTAGWHRARLHMTAGLLAAGALLPLGACTSAPEPLAATGAIPAAIPPEAPKVVAPPSADERDAQRMIGANGGLYRKPELDRYLDDIVQRLAAQSDRPDIPYRLSVLDSPSVNAFALPSGQLFVTRGLLALVNDDAEIAAVIGHEMAHVSERHALARQDFERQQALVTRVMADVVHDEAASRAHDQRSLATIASFSRQQELDADRIGIRTMAHAGFDPGGAARFLALMGRQVGAPAGGYDFQNAHPSTPERIAKAEAVGASFGPPGQGEHDHVGWLSIIDGLPYGQDPMQGYLSGRTFVHPGLGFGFEAPGGFTLTNTPQAILGLDGQGRALRFDTVDVKPGQPLASTLTSGWIGGIDASTRQAVRLNGIEAVTALARGDEWSFRLYAIRFGGKVYRLIFAARRLDEATDATFREAASSFRRLRPEDRQAVRTAHVEVTTVRAGDTLPALADRMAEPYRGLDTMLALNGLGAGDALTPGQRLKVVVR